MFFRSSILTMGFDDRWEYREPQICQAIGEPDIVRQNDYINNNSRATIPMSNFVLGHFHCTWIDREFVQRTNCIIIWIILLFHKPVRKSTNSGRRSTASCAIHFPWTLEQVLLFLRNMELNTRKALAECVELNHVKNNVWAKKKPSEGNIFET